MLLGIVTNTTSPKPLFSHNPRERNLTKKGGKKETKKTGRVSYKSYSSICLELFNSEEDDVFFFVVYFLIHKPFPSHLLLLMHLLRLYLLLSLLN